MFNMGYPELLALGFIAVLLFGNRLPEIAKSMGKGLTEFKKGMRGIEDNFRSAMREPPPSRTELPPSTKTRSPEVPKFSLDDEPSRTMESGSAPAVG